MAISWETYVRSRGMRTGLVIMAGVCTLLFLLLHDRSPQDPSLISNTSQSTSRYAYATFLSSRRTGAESIENDPYVIATRVMAYQLLHHPITKTRRNIPLVVITSPHIPDSIRKILISEGVTVMEVQDLIPQTWTPEPAQPRWIDQFTKLRLFELLTDYDRVLYMDNDMLITKCLDTIFDEEVVQTESATQNNTAFILPDEAPMPQSYVLAAAADQEGPEGERPKKTHDHTSLSGGFFVFKPSLDLFRYYVSVMELGKHKGRFNTAMMEMGLLNYAHRRGGNMPWTALTPGKWNSNWPSWRDYERSAATLHDKFWEPANSEWIDRRLVEMWWRVQGQMEGYWLWKGKGGEEGEQPVL